MSDEIRQERADHTRPQGYTITFPAAEGVRVFINDEDAAALKKLGKKIAVVPDHDEIVMGGSVYIKCPTEAAE